MSVAVDLGGKGIFTVNFVGGNNPVTLEGNHAVESRVFQSIEIEFVAIWRCHKIELTCLA